MASEKPQTARVLSKVQLSQVGQGAGEMSDLVNHPPHYTRHPSGVECITITEHMGFNVGNAMKYLWRCGLKGDEIEDLKKAVWYINREIQKRTNETIPRTPQTHSRQRRGKK
jgi:hypothetical protein